MENIKSDEGLRIFLIGYLSEKLGDHAILKGGMVLRLLHCPRYTNDLDYIFIPYRSKKEIVPLLRGVLKKLDGVQVQHRIHSTNAQFDVILQNVFGTFKTQIEVNAAGDCPTQSLSTSGVAEEHQLSPHIVRVMRFDVMLAHKLAAWNERRLVRDLYDTYFIYKFLNEIPDWETLKRRLENIQYAKKVSGKAGPRKMLIDDFLKLLEEEVQKLTEENVAAELRDYFVEKDWVGLDKKIKTALLQMIENLRS